MRTINRYNLFNSKAFTAAELLIGTLICFFIIAGTWGVYEMGLIWWYEQVPMIETQRIARSALSLIINGQYDATAGTDTMAGVNYSRRNGIVGATAYAIVGGNRINFALEPDAIGTTPRSFLLGVDAGTGQNIVQYIDSVGATHDLASTLGITSLQFVALSANIVRVTATVTQAQSLNRPNITASYSDTVYLRND